STLFPYTTLFRSHGCRAVAADCRPPRCPCIVGILRSSARALVFSDQQGSSHKRKALRTFGQSVCDPSLARSGTGPRLVGGVLLCSRPAYAHLRRSSANGKRGRRRGRVADLCLAEAIDRPR